MIDTLAAAYAEAGKFEAAVKFQEMAIKKTERSKWKELQEHFALYQQHKPFRLESKLARK